ncbi:MAG TPA: osmoprotectant NAGGN system M42 family peptidase, partial [Gammaproteobacteria bacterium]|nr:osmoprotectant NAGGN system M42 family peptidase [Gammaproteobacteria bacterium]
MSQKLRLNDAYLTKTMLEMLDIPSPTGFTDEIVHYVGHQLEQLGVNFELTRRGAIRADISGRRSDPDRSVVAHLDTIGAMVKELKSNGRLALVSIGTWSSRCAEGARVTLFTDYGHYRGTILPLKVSGHIYNEEVDTQPVEWTQLELRVDEFSNSQADLAQLGIHVGDFVAVDPQPEMTDSGFINSRHLDDKAGVAALLAAAKAIIDGHYTL